MSIVYNESERVVTLVTIATSGIYTQGNTDIPVSDSSIDVELVTSVTLLKDNGERLIMNFQVPPIIGTPTYQTVQSTLVSNNLRQAALNLEALPLVY